MLELLGVAALFAALFGAGLGFLSFFASRSSQELEPLEGAQLMSRQLGPGLGSGEYLTAWWALLLDSPWIASKSSPRIYTVVLFLISLGVVVDGLVEGHIGKVTIAALMYSVACGLTAWIMYLRFKLRGQGLDEVSWYDMPSLTSGAGSRERLWLAQWRLATVAKLVVSVGFLVVIAALIVEYWPTYNGPVDPDPDPAY